MYARDLVVSPFWSLAGSHSFSAALLPFFSTFVFLSSCPCFVSHEGGLAFCAVLGQ